MEGCAVAVARDFALAFDLPGSLLQRRSRRTRPEGRRAWMHVVFRHDKDVVSKNSVGGVDPARAARWARRQGVLDQPFGCWKSSSLGYLLFAQAKRSNSLMRSRSESSCSCLYRFLLVRLPLLERPKLEQMHKAEQRLSLLLRRSEPPFFARAKKEWPKESTAGREPMRLHRIGALRSSRNEGTAHNSLRSNTCASSPLVPLRCSARFTAGKSKAGKQRQERNHRQRQNHEQQPLPQAVTRLRFSRAWLSSRA